MTGNTTEYREQVARALQVFEDDADGLQVLGQFAVSDEFPYESLQLSRAIEQAGGDRASVALATLGPLVALGQYDEVVARIDVLTKAGEADLLMVLPIRSLPWASRAISTPCTRSWAK